MALLDSFTEASNTQITSHTSDSGHSWTGHAAGAQNGGTKYINIDATNDEAYGVTGFAGENLIYYSSWSPPSANQDVRAGLVRRGAYNTTQGIRIYARMSTGVTTGVPSNAYMFIVGNDNASGVIATLYKIVSGTPSSIGASSGALAMTVGSSYTFRLRAIGSAITTDYSADGGGSWTGIHSVTDTGVTQVGVVGFAYTDYLSSTASQQVNVTAFSGDIAPGPPLSRRRPSGLYVR